MKNMKKPVFNVAEFTYDIFEYKFESVIESSKQFYRNSMY